MVTFCMVSRNEKRQGSRGRIAYLSGAPRVSTRPDAQLGGPRSHILGVMSGFRALGWEVLPFIVGDRMPARVVRSSGAALRRSRAVTLASDLGRLALRPLKAMEAWRALGGKVDWVYERLATFQALGSAFKRRGVPWVLEVNALLYREAVAERASLVLSSVARHLELKAYRECDAIVCVSEALKESLVREAHVPSSKILVVPNGVDTQLFDPDQCAPRRLFGGFTIGFVGSVIPWQGLDLLLQSVSTLRRQGNHDLNVVVVGDGHALTSVQSLSNEMGLADCVRFVGRLPQAELPALITGFDVAYSGYMGLNGKQIYGSPLKLYEYMAMGRPVLASAVPDARALIREGENGFLFQPGNLDGLTSAIRKAYGARERLAEMGRRARADVTANHSWRARVDTIIAGTETILKERP